MAFPQMQFVDDGSPAPDLPLEQDVVRNLRNRQALGVQVVPSQYKQAWQEDVTQALREPVISTESLAGYSKAMFGVTLLAVTNGIQPTEVLDQIASEGFVTPEDVAALLAVSQTAGMLLDESDQQGGFAINLDRITGFIQSPEGQEVLDANIRANLQDFYAENPSQDTQGIRYLISQHTPGGEFSEPSSRTESQQQGLAQQYGKDAEFLLTEQGSLRSHRALAVSELLSAADENYVGAPTRTADRVISNLTTALGVGSRGSAGRGGIKQPIDPSNPRDLSLLRGQPDGKFAIASEYWRRQPENPNQPYNIYDEQGRPRFANYSTTTMPGAFNTLFSSSYPLGYGRQRLSALQQPGTLLSAAAEGDFSYGDGVRDLNVARNRLTPVRPDGMSEQRFAEFASQQNELEDKGNSWYSATYGPAFADFYNKQINPRLGVFSTGEAKRTYLSPVASDVAQVPTELISDPINLGAMLLGPAFSTARTAATPAGSMGARAAATGRSLIGSLSKAPGTLVDDAISEPIEGTALTYGIYDNPFEPMKTNALMSNKDPNSRGYDESLDANMAGWMQQQRATGNQYLKEARKK